MKVPYSPIASITSLESPRAESPATEITQANEQERTTPPPSGSTTPTSVDPGKKSFLGLSFSSTFLRPRYPSTSAKSTTTGELAKDAPDSNNDVDDADRQTIRGFELDPSADLALDPQAAAEKEAGATLAKSNGSPVYILSR